MPFIIAYRRPIRIDFAGYSDRPSGQFQMQYALLRSPGLPSQATAASPSTSSTSITESGDFHGNRWRTHLAAGIKIGSRYRELTMSDASLVLMTRKILASPARNRVDVHEERVAAEFSREFQQILSAAFGRNDRKLHGFDSSSGDTSFCALLPTAPVLRRAGRGS